ncbi:MAG: hypothetical protein ACKVHX_16345, partial [Alphaproteobacteria bacterium]
HRLNRRADGRHPHQAEGCEGDQMARIIVAEACGSLIAKSLKYNKAAAEVCTPSITYFAAPAHWVGQRVLKEFPK